MKINSTYFVLFFIVISLACCKNKPSEQDTQQVKIQEKNTYPIKPISIRKVKMTDSFWLPIIERIQEKTIAFAIEKCVQEGRLENFLIAGGQMEGETRGEMPFDDTDVYKIIEGASTSLISAPNKQLEQQLDSLISIIKVGQEPDGYLTTWRTINPGKPPASWVPVKDSTRWDGLYMSHELYNVGHLYEAAAVHFKATGKNNFLDIALKNADLMVKTFGNGKNQIGAVPGHQIIETGLIKLYEITLNESYLNLAKYFLDSRGDPTTHELFGSYLQDHVPVTQQKEVVGHSVRAVYMYAAMADIAALKNDTSYVEANINLWNNMVHKKMYVTGGIGALHDGEQFGANYELPNLTAYSETCAAIGDVYWNHRLHNLTGEVKYFDIIERTLYNSLISGISLSGTEFFYPNALESDGIYKFNKGACTRQEWFDCSCCPTNLIRFLPTMPELVYSTAEDTVFVNLYASSIAEMEFDDHSIQLSQETAYPWNGKIKLTVSPVEAMELRLKLRVPGWARNEVLPGDLYNYVRTIAQNNSITVNGDPIEVYEQEGYFAIRRKWNKGDVIEINFPMEVRKVKANNLVEENKGKLSLEYGPLVYAVEEIDNPNSINQISISKDTHLKIKMQHELLGGVNTLSNQNLTAIPYYTWSNRGVGKMKVWLPEDPN